MRKILHYLSIVLAFIWTTQVFAAEGQPRNEFRSLTALWETENAPLIYGALFNSDEAGFKRGIYSVEATAEAVLTSVYEKDDMAIRAGAYVGGKYYAFMQTGTSDNLSYNLTVLNVDTWQPEGTPVAITEDASIVRAMAHDASTGITYAIIKGTNNYGTLGTINLSTGDISVIGEAKDLKAPFKNVRQGVALAISPSGDLYFIANTGMIHLVDKETGELNERIYDTGVPTHNANPCSSAVINPETGKFYWTFVSAIPSNYKTGLYEVDLVAQTRKLLVGFENNEQINGIFIKNEEEPPVPAEPPVIFGAIIDSNISGSLRGVYSIPTATPGVINKVLDKDEMAVWDGVYIDGKYYAYIFKVIDNNTPVCEFTVYDAETWEVIGSPISSRDLPLSDMLSLMAYDITTGSTYALTRTNPNANRTLSIVDLKTGRTKQIADIEADEVPNFTPVILAADAKGQLYTIAGNTGTYSGSLFSIDKKTGKATLIGATGVLPYSSRRTGAIFDHNTGKLYWAFNGGSNPFGLYEINVSTGAATLVTGFPNNQHMTGLFIKDAIPVDEAPAEVTDLRFIPDAPGGLTGKVSFKVPVSTYGGGFLGGKLKGTMKIGAQSDIRLSNLTPGSEYTSDVITLDESGNVMFRVQLTNDAGYGPEAKIRFFAGLDTPLAVTDVLLKNETNNAVISWNAPVAGVNGGYLDVSNMKYRLTRLPDNIVIDNISSPSYTDMNVQTLNYYSYSIVPYINELDGEAVVSNELLLGNPFTVPYDGTFSESSFKLWTVVDNNSDLRTWVYDDSYKAVTSMTATAAGGGDDWLFSPPIVLDEKGVYQLNYFIRTMTGWASENLRVTIGKSLNPEDHKEIADYPSFKNTTGLNESHKILIPVGEGGIYYIGFYCYSEKIDQFKILLKDVSLKYLVKPTAPNVVTDLSTTFDVNEKILPTISFKAPITDVAGDELSGITSIDIFCGEEEVAVKTFSPVTLGQKFSWKDENPIEGTNEYKIIARNSDGPGLDVIYKVYAGHDAPEAVGNLELKNINGEAILSWIAPVKGVKNGYIDAATAKYKITRNDGTVLEEAYEGTTYNDNTLSKEDQNLVLYTVTSINTGGTGESATTETIRFGKAYQAPYSESFAKGNYQKPGWTIDGANAWVISETALRPVASSQDGDKGVAYFKSHDLTGGTTSRLITPILNVSTVTNPILRFWFYHHQPFVGNNHGEILRVFASKNDGDFEIISENIVIDGDNEGWKLYEIPLSAYKGIENLRIAFDGYIQYSGGYDLTIDNILVDNQPEKDLRISAVQGPTRLQAGSNNNIYKVTIKNSGIEAAGNYTIDLYNGDAKIANVDGVNILPGALATFDLNIEPILSDVGKTYKLRSEINYEGDGNSDNNVSDVVEIQVVSSAYLPATELEADILDDKVILNWMAPIDPVKPIDVAEGFEAYTAFDVTNIGDWTMVDVDGEKTYYPEDYFTYPYPNRGGEMAFQVFNPYMARVEWLSDFNPRSGRQSMISFGVVSNKTNNDWMISPLLSGTAQTVSFYAKSVQANANPERFVMYYSETDKNPENFIKMTTADYQEVPGIWTEYKYDLPEGAKHFAIRSVSNNGIGLMIDDVSFFKAGENIEVLGYDLYRNGVKVNESPIAGITFEDENPVAGSNIYTVCAVYEDGRSELSAPVTIVYEPQSITPGQYDAVKIYTENQTIVVKGVYDGTLEIITIEGRLISRKPATGEDRIPVDDGIYLVKIGNRVTKVLVK